MADAQPAGKVMTKGDGAGKLHKVRVASTTACQKKLDNRLVLPSIINLQRATNENEA
jgi:hypothetical protein